MLLHHLEERIAQPHQRPAVGRGRGGRDRRCSGGVRIPPRRCRSEQVLPLHPGAASRFPRGRHRRGDSGCGRRLRRLRRPRLPATRGTRALPRPHGDLAPAPSQQPRRHLGRLRGQLHRRARRQQQVLRRAAPPRHVALERVLVHPAPALLEPVVDLVAHGRRVGGWVGRYDEMDLELLGRVRGG